MISGVILRDCPLPTMKSSTYTVGTSQVPDSTIISMASSSISVPCSMLSKPDPTADLTAPAP